MCELYLTTTSNASFSANLRSSPRTNSVLTHHHPTESISASLQITPHVYLQKINQVLTWNQERLVTLYCQRPSSPLRPFSPEALLIIQLGSSCLSVIRRLWPVGPGNLPSERLSGSFQSSLLKCCFPRHDSH